MGKYIYDADRLIFYNSEYSAEVIERINREIHITDEYEKLLESFENYDSNNMKFKLRGLDEVGICLTNNCNLRCNYCSDSSVEGYCEYLTVNDVLVFMKEMLKGRSIEKLISKKDIPMKVYFTGGGEPTYNWELFKNCVIAIENLCKTNSIPFELGVTTNGVLNDFQREFLVEHFSTIMLSYDGMPVIQNKNRKTAKLTESSSLVEKSIKKFSEEDIELTVRTTIWQDDFYKMKEMADFLIGKFNGHFEWSIRPIIPLGRALERTEVEQEKLKEYNFLESYENLRCYVETKYQYMKLSNPVFPNCLNSYSCGAVSPYCRCLWLLPDKSIITCIESMHSKTEIGRVGENGVEFHETYEDPILEMCKKKLSDCRGCIAYRFCKGGCPVRHLEEGSSHTKLNEWECKMIKEYWVNIFTQILQGKESNGWKVEKIIGEKLSDLEILKLVRVDEETSYEN